MRVSANPDQAILEAERMLNARIKVVDINHPAKLLIQADTALRHCQHEGKELGKLGVGTRTNMRKAEDALLEAESQWNQKKRQREDAGEELDSHDEADADDESRPDFSGGKRLVDEDDTNAVAPARRRKIASAELRGWFDVPAQTTGRYSSKKMRVKRLKQDNWR